MNKFESENEKLMATVELELRDRLRQQEEQIDRQKKKISAQAERINAQAAEIDKQNDRIFVMNENIIKLYDEILVNRVALDEIDEGIRSEIRKCNRTLQSPPENEVDINELERAIRKRYGLEDALYTVEKFMKIRLEEITAIRS